MKILYVTTISNTVNAFLIPHIKMLIEEGHQVDVAFNIIADVKKELFDLNVKVHNIPFSRSSPINKKNISAYKLFKKLVVEEKYDIVHTHTPVASAIVRIACKNIGETRVFYTAHGFHFYKGAPILNWLIYYPLEKYLSRYTDTLITINQEDYKRSTAKLHTKQIEYVHGVGIDLEKIHNIEVNKVQKRKELNIPADAFVILSVGELNKNKNHEVVIKAIAELKNPSIYYIICGEGYLKKYLISLAKKYNIDSNIRFLGYRNDVLEIYKVTDLFVFPSLREGLPVSVIEAMAMNIPIITNNIRGSIDLVLNNINGLIVNVNDKEKLGKSISYLNKNKTKRNEFGNNSMKYIENYSLENILKMLKNIYS